MSLAIDFDKKGHATLLETDGERATLECEFSSPPGAPLIGQLIQSRQRVELKVHGCRSVSPDAQRFVIRGRWVNLSRLAKAELLGSRVGAGGLRAPEGSETGGAGSSSAPEGPEGASRPSP